MSVHVAQRLATDEEMDLLERQWLSPKAYAVLMSLAAFLLYWVLAFAVLMTIGAVASVMASRSPPGQTANGLSAWPAWAQGALIFVLWAPVFIVPAVVAVRRYRRAKAQRVPGWQDRRGRQIEIVALTDAPYTTIDDAGAGTFHVFDMPGAGALCLAKYNQFWLSRTDQIIEELEEELQDSSEEEIERVLARRLPAFPARSFQIHRWPGTGLVVDIRTEGELRDAEETIALKDLPIGVATRLAPAWQRDSTLLPLQRSDLH